MDSGDLAKLEFIMDKVPFGINIIDKNLRIIRVNKVVEESLGKSSEEIRGRYCYEVLKNNVESNGKICDGCGVVRAIEDGKNHTFEIEVHGSVVKCFAISIKEDGVVVAVLEIIQDITERKSLKEELKLKEEKFREIFENSLDAIVITDLDGNIVGVNRGFESITGFSRQEVLGESFVNLVPKEEAREIFKKYHEAYHSGRNIYSIEFEFFTKNGERRIAEGNVSLIKRNGRIIGFQGNFRDVTERKRIEERLRESERRYRMLVNSSIDGIITVNNAAEILNWNRGAEKIFGYKAEEILGKKLTIIIPKRLQKRFMRAFERIATSNVSDMELGRTIETRGLRKNGEEFPIELSYYAWRSGEKVFFTSIVRDITERKRLEQALRDSEELFRKLAEKSLVGIYLIQDGVFKYVNPKLAELLGYQVGELIGKNPLDVVYPEDRETVREKIEKRLNGEIESANYLLRTVRKDGELRYNEVYGSRINYRGKPAVVGTLIDLTDRVKFMDTKQRCSKQIEKNIENYMLLADQIRNPLAIILGATELKLNGNPSKKDLEELKEVILSSVERIERMLSRLDKGWFESEEVKNLLEESGLECMWSRTKRTKNKSKNKSKKEKELSSIR